MSNGYVQVPVDSTGKKIDTDEVARPDGNLVERQRVVIVDGSRAERALAEMHLIAALDQAANQFVTRKSERGGQTDRRGSTGRGSTR